MALTAVIAKWQVLFVDSFTDNYLHTILFWLFFFGSSQDILSILFCFHLHVTDEVQ